MPPSAKVRERFLRDATPVRLGGIAATLARIESFSADAESIDIVEELIEETRCFVGWVSGDDLSAESAGLLSALDGRLQFWQQKLRGIRSSDNDRRSLAQEAAVFSARLLELSALAALRAR